VQCDIRDPAPFVEAALAEYGAIDGLVVNAGVVRDRSFAKMTAEEWSEVIDVHLGGSFACAKAVWEPMTARGRGSIIFTTSGAGMHGAFGQANYSAAKAGIIGLMKTLAIEGERVGIRANAIAPMALTEMTGGVFSDRMKHGLRPEQISPFLIALLDPLSTRTGEIVECGGWRRRHSALNSICRRRPPIRWAPHLATRGRCTGWREWSLRVPLPRA
jgi:NAD(P)-dependent dehydrogenase (short-subunit alcohol dehydrogenase family)